MTSELSDALIRTWVTGWSRTHDYDVQHDGELHLALRTGDSDEWEYVLHAPAEDRLRAAAQAVAKVPGRLLTVILSPKEGTPPRAALGDLELISNEERLMVVDMGTQDVEDPIAPEGFTGVREDFDGWTLFTVYDGDAVAARGRVAVVEHHAVLDRIFTADDYRRQGLGTYVTRALIAIALESDVDEGLLVATGEGVELYEYLGWTPLGSVHVFGVQDSEPSRSSHSQFDDTVE